MVVYNYFKGGDPQTWRYARYHENVEKLDKYKNNWEFLEQNLNPSIPQKPLT
jgi:hypothetical protein